MQTSSAKKPMRFLKNPKILITAAVIIAAIVVALCLLLRKKPQAAAVPVVAVDTVKVDNVSVYGEYVGRIRAQQFVEVHARVEGFLEKMLFDEGTFVKKGETLFIIDPTLYRANAEKARADRKTSCRERV